MDKKSARIRRATRARRKLQELGATRLVVHRTPRHIYAQVIAPNGSEAVSYTHLDVYKRQRQDRLIVVEKFSVEAPKTKLLAQKLNDMALEDVLIITGELDENLFLAARNLHKVDVRDATGIDPVSLIAFDKVVMTADAVKQVEEMLA